VVPRIKETPEISRLGGLFCGWLWNVTRLSAQARLQFRLGTYRRPEIAVLGYPSTRRGAFCLRLVSALRNGGNRTFGFCTVERSPFAVLLKVLAFSQGRGGL
jgi:hypothetical protein